MAYRILSLVAGRLREIAKTDATGIYLPNGINSTRDPAPSSTSDAIFRVGPDQELQLGTTIKGWRSVTPARVNFPMEFFNGYEYTLPFPPEKIEVAFTNLSHSTAGSSVAFEFSLLDSAGNPLTGTTITASITSGASPTIASATNGVRTMTIGAAGMMAGTMSFTRTKSFNDSVSAFAVNMLGGNLTGTIFTASGVLEGTETHPTKLRCRFLGGLIADSGNLMISVVS